MIEDTSHIHTIVSRCDCTGEGGLQLHLSKTAIAFVVALLDRNNHEIWKGQDKDSIKLIETIGRCLARDIKRAMLSGLPVERMDPELAEQKRKEEQEMPVMIMTLSELLAVADDMLSRSDKQKQEQENRKN